MGGGSYDAVDTIDAWASVGKAMKRLESRVKQGKANLNFNLMFRQFQSSTQFRAGLLRAPESAGTRGGGAGEGRLSAEVCVWGGGWGRQRRGVSQAR